MANPRKNRRRDVVVREGGPATALLPSRGSGNGVGDASDAQDELSTMAPVTGVREFVVDNVMLEDIGLITFEVESTAPLLMQQFSQKKRAIVCGTQDGTLEKAGRAPKDWEGDFLDSLYIIGKRPKSPEQIAKCVVAVPAKGWHEGIVRAAGLSGAKMTTVKSSVFVRADERDDGGVLVAIEPTCPVEMDIRPVRQQRTIDMRSRALIRSWKSTFTVEYLARCVSAKNVIAWLNLGGRAVGLCELRPRGRESSGTLGTYRVVRARVIEPTFGREPKEAA